MQMSRADIRSYPKLAYYVKNNLSEILAVPVIVSAIQRIGQINLPTLHQALRWGMGQLYESHLWLELAVSLHQTLTRTKSE